MAEEIIFKVGVDTGDSVQDVNKVGDAIEGVDKEAKKTGSSFVNLKKELRQLTIQLQGLDPASKEFEQVAQRAGKIKEQLRGVADAINDADPEKFGGKFQRTAEGIAGAFSAVTGAQALFGKNSEEIEKQMLKVQGAIALTQGISAMKELRNDAGDLAMSIKGKVIGAFTSLTTAEIANAQATGTMTGLQKAYAFAVGTSTGAMKIFKIALASTGIGLLIVGLGLAADAMGLFGNSSDEAAEKIKKLKEQQEKHKQQLQGELDLLTKLRQERKGGSNDLEAQIKILKAKGATDKEIYNAERELIRKGLDELSFAEGFKGKLNLEERTRKRQLKTDLIALDAEYYRSVQEKQETDNKESLAKEKERNAKIKEEKEKARREQLELERKIQDLTIANIEDTDTREIIALTTKHSRELEEIQKQYGKKKEFAELEKQLKIQQGIELENLEKEQATKTAEQKQAEKDKANLDAKSKLEADLIRAEEDFNLKQQKRIELENLDFAQQMQNTTLTNGEIEKIKAQHEANLVGITADSVERQKQLDQALADSKSFLVDQTSAMFGALASSMQQGSAIQKAFAVTQVTIDTAKAISSVIAGATAAAAAGGPAAPFLIGGYIASGIASVTKAFASVNSILKQPLPSVQAPSMNRPSTNFNAEGGTQTQQEVKAQSTFKVVVVDSDITKMQDKTKKVQAISTI